MPQDGIQPLQPATTADFNMTFEVGKDNKRVTIYAADLKQVAAKGLHFSLDAGTTVEIGTLKDFIEWLNQKLAAAGVTADFQVPTEAGSDWPEIIKSIFTNTLNANTAVTKFNFNLGKKNAANKYPVSFSLGVTSTLADPIPLTGFFRIVGGGVGVTRTDSPVDATPPTNSPPV